MSRPWVVLKFGGTSVATAENWGRIAARAQALVGKHRVWIVASALSQVSNRLEAAIAAALRGELGEDLAWIEARHHELGQALGLDEADMAPVVERLDELRTVLSGVKLVQEASPGLRARVMSFGELASTWLGVAALRKAGLNARRVDARTLLAADTPGGAPDDTRYLSARVSPTKNVAAAESAAGDAEVVITQGFIARTEEGHTCLLGRGGSDTSASLFAAFVGAEKLEIWTDVHGLFTTDPRQLPSARLLTSVRYREAQELAAMGAKVLHPRCLEPVAWAQVPLEIRNTRAPDAPSTTIGPSTHDDPAVMAVVRRNGVTLLSVQTLAMWGVPGFLSKVFERCAAHGVSVDLVATSQSAVTVTLDHVPGGLQSPAFRRLVDELGELGNVEVLADRSVVSMVGRHIRTVLHELGESFAAFEEKHVHLVSASSEDLNISFVVDPEDAQRLVRDLHARLLGTGRKAPWLGPTWSELTGDVEEEEEVPMPPRWWTSRREELLALCTDGKPRYVYDLATVKAQADGLRTKLTRVNQRFYAMKANNQPDVLRTIANAGFGIECVSAGEVRFARELLGDEVPILFTPNFCPIEEYEIAYQAGAEVTIDGPDVLNLAPQVFANREVALRIDPGGGKGHHDKVKTAGAKAKFGHPWAHVDEVAEAAARVGATVVGLHAHVGSGILEPEPWSRTARTLLALRSVFPDVRWIDLGGGLGVVERPGQAPLDLEAVDAALATVEGIDEVEIRVEPGRYLVAEAGVLLVPVTQVRQKGEVRFIGGAAGMNALIRPALYGAWHAIHNLTRLDAPPGPPAEIVGPICETGDILGHDRSLPYTSPGDILLIDTAGAYGAVMASDYNMRDRAEETALLPS